MIFVSSTSSHGTPEIENSPSPINTRQTESEMMCSADMGATQDPSSFSGRQRFKSKDSGRLVPALPVEATETRGLQRAAWTRRLPFFASLHPWLDIGDRNVIARRRQAKF